MKLLVTGGAGKVGRELRKELSGRVTQLRCFDLAAPATLSPNEESMVGDIADLGAVEAAMAGMDCVVHLAAVSTEGPWDAIIRTNVVGTANVYEAAHRTGVGRVVFGSSNHAVGFYPRSQTIGVSEACRPDSRYGLSKCWGEDVGALYAEKHGVKSLHIRIGNALGLPTSVRTMAIWISIRDLAQLVMIGLTHPDIHNTIVYGVSDNDTCWYDNSAARALGYKPQDRSQDHKAGALAGEAQVVMDDVGRYYQGGTFCSAEYTGPAVPKV
jgi:uronate dehydrogenase